jgi:dihydrofolate reductase
MTVSIIVAHAQNRVIGSDGDIPWHLRDDLLFFKDATLGNVVIMGRKTYESIPDKHRPLKDRLTYVITRNPDYYIDEPNVRVFQNFEKALFSASLIARDSEVFIAGGEEIYRLALPHTTKIYATVLLQDYEGDRYFPKLPNEEWRILDTVEDFHDEQLDILYRRYIYQRKEEP